MDKLISGYNVRSDPALWSLLQKSFPILFRLIISFDTTHIPDELRPILIEIVKKSKRPFEAVKPEQEVAFSDVDDSCSFYPHLTRTFQKIVQSRLKPETSHVLQGIQRSSFSSPWNIYCVLSSR